MVALQRFYSFTAPVNFAAFRECRNASEGRRGIACRIRRFYVCIGKNSLEMLSLLGTPKLTGMVENPTYHLSCFPVRALGQNLDYE